MIIVFEIIVIDIWLNIFHGKAVSLNTHTPDAPPPLDPPLAL
jgi:hypothetical protein